MCTRRTVHAHLRAAAALGVVAAAVLAVGPVATAAAQSSEPSARFFSNPPEDSQLVGYCADQTQLANNLDMQGDHDRAMNVVGAANLRGCRIYTFQTT